jgi:hypothetical protein
MIRLLWALTQKPAALMLVCVLPFIVVGHAAPAGNDCVIGYNPDVHTRRRIHTVHKSAAYAWRILHSEDTKYAKCTRRNFSNHN